MPSNGARIDTVDMDDAELPEGADRLAAFVGDWSVAGWLDDGTDRLEVSGTWSFTAAADGWGVVGLMRTEIEGMGSFEEREIVGFDNEHGEVHMFSMNKFAIRDHVGAWEDDRRLVTVYTHQDGARVVTEEIAVAFTETDHMSARVVEQVDGHVALITELALTRV